MAQTLDKSTERTAAGAREWPTNARILLAAVCRTRRLTMSEWAWLNRVPLEQVMACVGKDGPARERVGREAAEKIERAIINSACAAGLLSPEEPENEVARR